MKSIKETYTPKLNKGFAVDEETHNMVIEKLNEINKRYKWNLGINVFINSFIRYWISKTNINDINEYVKWMNEQKNDE